MTYLTKEKVSGIFADFGGKAANTGSIEGQIALFNKGVAPYAVHQLVFGDHLTAAFNQRQQEVKSLGRNCNRRLFIQQQAFRRD